MKNMTIALADDDQDDRFFFKKAIDDLKMSTELLLFDDGATLMEYLNQQEKLVPHIVFLDLNMPIKSGMDCLIEIRSNSRLANMSIAIYSTSSSEKDINATFVNGANIYINKPTKLNLLKETIAKVLQQDFQYHTSNLNKDSYLFRI